MPRARRKAAQAKNGGVVKDFVKRKERLGKKAVRENATNTRIKSRQIYVPGGLDEDAVVASALKRGLTYQQLVTRVTHYNWNSRISALNGLAKAVSDGTLAASAHARLDGINLVRISLNALQDDEVGVRNSSIGLLTALVRQLKSVKPIAQLLTATLMACLSHIRKDVQIVAAQAITSVFDNSNDSDMNILPVHVFGAKLGDVLVGLANLLSTAKIPKKKAVIINAIAAVLGSASSRKTKLSLTATKKKKTPISVPEPFYYHSLEDVSDAENDNSVLRVSVEMNLALNTVTKRVANIVLECLPIHETKKDKPLVSVLLASVRCLHIALSSGEIEEPNAKLADRILKNWSKERNRHHDRGTLHTVHSYIAGIGHAVKDWKVCADYLTNSLNPAVIPVPTGIEQLGNSNGNGKMSVECVTEMFLKSPGTHIDSDIDIAEEKDRVRDAWVIRWMHALETDNIYYIGSTVSVSILRTIVGNISSDGDDDMSWEIVLKLPAVVAMAVAREIVDEDEPMSELVECTLKALANQCRRKHARIGAELVPEIEAELCDEKVVRAIDDCYMDEFMAVLFYSGTLFGMKMLRIVVNNFSEEKGLRFAAAFFNIVDAHFADFRNSSSNILDLYAAASIVAEASQHFEDNIPLANECTQVANRIMVRIDGGDT